MSSTDHNRITRLIVLTLLAVLLLGSCSGTRAEKPESVAPIPELVDEGVFGEIPEIVDRVAPSVVAILTDNGQGSGVIWGEDGTIVTNSTLSGTRER